MTMPTVFLLLALAGPSDGPAVEGLVVGPDGAPAPHALVTVHRDDGVSVTVYADDRGRYVLPPLPGGTYRVEARLPGVGAARAEASGAGAPGPDLRLETPDPVPPPGSAFLNALPDGERKRRFILDCTGCHVLDAAVALPEGAPRDAEGWAQGIARMRDMFGPGTGFPVISGWADPASLSTWLHEHLPGTLPPEPGTPAPERGRAVGGVLTEYALPEPGDLPHDLAVDPGGDVVVTGMFTHRMYVLDPATGRFSTEPIPVEDANPRAVEIGDDGLWWVLLGVPRAVARHDPATGRWDSWPVGAYPHSVVRDREGRVWFNGHFSVNPEIVGRLDPATGEVRRWEVPPTGDGVESTMPYGLRIDGQGVVWGTQLHGNHLVRLDPATDEVETFAMPSPHAGPRRPDVGADGAVWIPQYAAGRLARFDPATRTFREWALPVPDALPYVVRVDRRRGTVWIGTGHGDAVLSFDPSTERFTVYRLPTRGALVRHLDVDERTGAVWAAYGASPGVAARILRIEPPGAGAAGG